MKRIATMILLYLIFLLPFLLLGCGTTGKETRVETQITINNNTGEIFIGPETSTKSGDLKNESANDTDVPIEGEIPIIKADPASKLQKAIEDKTNTNIEKAVEEIAPIKPVDNFSIVPEGRHIETDYVMEYRANHRRPFVWLENTGADFKGPVKFTTLPSGYTMTVQDPTDNFRAEGLYFCGTKNRPAEANGNRASFFGKLGSKDTILVIEVGE